MKEANLKKAVDDYLTILERQGKLLSFRLNSGDFVLSNPDGSYRRRIRGCRKGTSDFLVMVPHRNPRDQGLYYALFLELKGEHGKQSAEQIEFEEHVKSLGGSYFLIRSLGQLIELINTVLKS